MWSCIRFLCCAWGSASWELQPPLSLSFLQAQLLKQLLQKLAFGKDEQGFHCSCRAVILPAPCGEARGGVVVAEGISGWEAETLKANRGWVPAVENALTRNQVSSMGFGAEPHVFRKPGEFSHKMELWTCAFQRRVFDRRKSGRSWRMCRLPLPSHTSSPGGKERSPPAPQQTFRGQWAACGGLVTLQPSPPHG